MQTLDRIQRSGSHTAGPLAARLPFAVVILVCGAAWAYGGLADLEAPRRLAETKIRTALSPETPPAQRNQLLTEATALLKAIVARRAEAEMPPEELLKHFRLRLRLIETIGILRSQEYAFRLLHLRGEEPDRPRLAELSAEARELIASLEGDMEQTLGDWSADLKKLVTVMPELEDIQMAVAYNKVWAELYAGISLHPPARRSQSLRRAVAVAEAMIEECVYPDRLGAGVGLALGIVHRELGEHQRAAEFLVPAACQAVSEAVRGEALFQLARNAVEEASSAGPDTEKFTQAKLAIGTLPQAANQSADARLEADLDAALLEHALYTGVSPHAPDTAAAEVLTVRAQEALLAFLDQHPGPAEQDMLLTALAGRRAAEADDIPTDRPFMLLAASSDGRPLGSADEASAEADLKRLIDSDEAIPLRLRPLALWRLGALLQRSGRLTEAGRAFLALAREHQGEAMAEAAALRAVRDLHQGLEQLSAADRPAPRAEREEFVDAVRRLQDDRPDNLELAEWSFSLGWHLEKLAAANPPGPHGRELLARAIAAYERQPASSPTHMEARYRAIELRIRQWRQAEADPQARAEPGRQLLTLLREFCNAAAVQAVQRARSESAADLRSWASRADLYAAEILYDLPGRRSEAMALLRTLPDRWPETSAAELSAEFEIRKLLEQGQTAAAVTRARQFHSQRPGKDQQLLQAVLIRVRQRIGQLRGRPEKAWQLTRFRKDTLHLAEALYQGCRQLPIQERYFATQMLAEALLENGQPAQAAELFRQCLDYDMARQAEADTPAESALKEGRPAPEKSRNSPEELERSADGIEATYKAQHERQEARVGLDAGNLFGLARAYRSLGRFNESLDYYQRLLAGLSPVAEPALYWRGELEYCQCLLKGFANQKDVMRKLGVRIRQLRIQDPEMGGLAETFLAVQLQVSRLAP